MAKYRSKPKVIEAAKIMAVDGSEVAFDVGDGDDKWLQDALSKDIGADGGIWVLNEGVRIGTLEGTMRAAAGDYVVKGVCGEIYAVRGDVFIQTYEPLTP